jgi:hypothetical protein
MAFDIYQKIVNQDGEPIEKKAGAYRQQLFELFKEMSNPANFGMAKSLIMMGKARGFDMATEEGINEWMATYNAELTQGTGPRIPLPAPSFSIYQGESLLTN